MYWQQVGLVLLWALLASEVSADKLEDAYRLLRITSAGQNFEQATRRQTDAVIREYAIIVASSTNRELPEFIKREITRCYAEALAWDQVEPGFAAIFAENLSAAELRMLIDFLSDKSVPPPLIDQFREMVAKADAIEQLAIDFMFDNTDSCEVRSVNMILEYLGDSN
jgi:hypothetical protein